MSDRDDFAGPCPVSDREDLAREALSVFLFNRPLFGDGGTDPVGWRFLADAIIDAGWQPPRVHWGCDGTRLPGASWCACGATIFTETG